ncbi:MAG: SH3 domain-containing protein [Spirochaetaceae bacterium]|nr:SH3 domain-containing protein [Spirochaetaceae bacterium]
MRTRITKITVLLMVLLLAISANIGTKAAAQTSTNAQPSSRTGTDAQADIRFVNAIEGLPLRKTEFIDSEVIGILQNKEQVEVLSKSSTSIQIGSLYDNWYEIKTSDNKTGYVFGGYLQKSVETIDIIQQLEGEYLDEKGEYFVTIENTGESWGNLMFRIKTNYPMFNSKIVNVRLADIYSKVLFYNAIDGRGGLGGDITVKFDAEKRLTFHEYIYECDFDPNADELIPINIRETDNTEILRKTATNLRDKARIVQSANGSLSNERNQAAYKDFTNFLWDKNKFIRDNNDLYETLSQIDYDGEYDYEWSFTYKSNGIIAGNTSFVNNVLLEDAPIKIGMTKSDVYDLLGIPSRLIRENNKDYIDYFYSMYMKDLYAGDGTFYASTSIGFYFDENDVITKIGLLVEGIEEPDVR